tara:strand:- start:192 stop:932 length:741 start_codon:yes stop_codon:yes gene_type:complete
MGANAQTAVPVFTAGQVLTAQQQTEINTGIPVFATTVTRDAAFGGAGEKTLAEGQFAYIEATNTTQYYDGSNWQSVGVAPGLVFITGTTFSAVTSVSLPTSTFSSTYQNYLVIFNNTTATSNCNLTLRMRAAGTDATAGNYQNMLKKVTNVNTEAIIGTNSQTSFFMADQSASTLYTAIVNVQGSNLAQNTVINPQIYSTTTGTSQNSFVGLSVLSDTTQYDSLTLISSVATNITGNYKVYGYANS